MDIAFITLPLVAWFGEGNVGWGHLTDVTLQVRDIRNFRAWVQDTDQQRTSVYRPVTKVYVANFEADSKLLGPDSGQYRSPVLRDRDGMHRLLIGVDSMFLAKELGSHVMKFS